MIYFFKMCLILTIAVFANGCAKLPSVASISDALIGPANEGPSLAQVLRDGGESGEAVRWGGRIARIENNSDHSLLEIVEQPLGPRGRPKKNADSGGRFLARIEGFVDPVIYAPDKLITISGRLNGAVDGQIGDYLYRFPLITSDEHKLWVQRLPATHVYVSHSAYFDPLAYRPRPRLRRPHHQQP